MRIATGASRRSAALLALLLLAGSAATAWADRGVAVDIGKIEVIQGLSPGGNYTLPTIGVSNPGTESSVYLMGLSRVEGQTGLVPPLTWFEFSPPRFVLEPGASLPVRVELRIPTNAHPGAYAALLQAQLSPEGTGVQVGAAAASRLSFTVNPSTTLQAWLLRLQTLVRKRAPWSYAVPAAAALLALAWWTNRRYAFRLERRQ